MAEKMIKIATPKEHPYSSHISKFAMFPSFRSPDDPETGVRAAFQPFLNPLIPNCAPDMTLLSKTMGAPYRHEVLDTPMATRTKAATWNGEHGFLDQTRPLKGQNQVFYPAPPKTVLPNPKLRAWDLSLSERTSNMLRNLEKTHWVTSYQMHYTGSGPANPLKIDDFSDKMCDLTGMSSHSAPLSRQEANAARISDTERPLDLYNRPLSQGEMKANGEKSLHAKDESSRKMEPFRAGRNISSLNKSDVAKDMAGIESHDELSSGAAAEQEKLALGSVSKSCILPRPPVLPGIHPLDRCGEGAALSLLDVQSSFSKTTAHRNFNSSITRAAVNLRDNIVTGKKHDFYGINCHYLHG
ncbi:uncharacterized protein C7orf31 homolog [Sparus aurata]|uniref:uncharacterized protein C7orf31 homolog n=1 Tax=Sparus aurata TaxID=8175 RepID=UPI0011C1BE83|nr:uncharacterized protein C7orf31 homolog [Sparus aurata]